MTEYDNTSAYSATNTREYYLDLMVNRPIPNESDDVEFTINETYSMRPDLLAFDLYEDSDLWWVFAQRNPDVLKNPLHDFKTGTTVFLPKLETLRNALGF